jgi:hypothetical protein
MSVILALLLILVVGGFFAGLVGWVMLVVRAFRVSPWWGLGVLLGSCTAGIVPIIFIARNWRDAKLPAALWLGGFVLAGAGWAVVGAAFPSRSPGSWGEPGVEERSTPAPASTQRQIDTAPPAEQPPPPPAATPTAYVPDSLLDYTPKPRTRPYLEPTPGSDEDFELTVATANQRLGWTMRVVTSDGREFEGTLLAVDDHALTFERRFSTGSMIFPIPRADVAKLELKQ